MFFSLIIPCYNTPVENIERLLHSVEIQDIPNEDLEIIIVDDNSTDKSYLDKVNTFHLNIKVVDTDTRIHCPGNTRRKGMEYVTGDWLFFCDHDDYFEPNAFKQVQNYIHANEDDHTIYIVSTIMNGYCEEKQQYGVEFAHKQAWLHGKWYSMNNLIKPFNINFKEDLVTHEDIYFNALCLNALFQTFDDWDYVDIKTYRWVDDPKSITRQERGDRGYLYENFADYIISAAEPYWENARDDHNPIFVNQILMTLLHAYFYYEAASYFNGPKDFKDVLGYIINFEHKIIKDLGYNSDYIIDFVYVDALKFAQVQADCEICTGKFICKTSFRDFVYKLEKMEV